MTWNSWTVQYNTGTSWITLNNVQNITCNIGRRNIQSDWPISSATFVIRYPNGFSSPLSNLLIGKNVRFYAPGRTNPSWAGVIRDVSIEYGIPYTGGVGEADYLTITAEGALSYWITRIQPTPPLSNDLPSMLSFYDVLYSLFQTNTLTNEQTLGGEFTSFFDYVTNAVKAVQARLLDGAVIPASGQPEIFIGKAGQTTLATVGFSDTTNDTNNRRYEALEFDSLSDNWVTYVTVTNPDGVTAQAGTDLVNDRRYYEYSAPFVASRGSDLASYLLSQFKDQTLSVSAITAQSEAQHTNNLDTLGVTDFWKLPNYKIKIVFRGTTIYAQIEGVSLSATPNGARFTYYLSPDSMNNFLILDDSRYGQLNNNRLGIW